MNQITEVAVMDEGEYGFTVYYRASLLQGQRVSYQCRTWRLFDTLYDRANAIAEAVSLLGRTWPILTRGPGEDAPAGDYIGAWNAKPVYRVALPVEHHA